MFEHAPEKIIVDFGFAEMKRTIPELILHEGLPSRKQIEDWGTGPDHTILMSEMTKSEDSINQFYFTAHHTKVTVLFITQYLYMSGKLSRTISLNCHYT